MTSTHNGSSAWRSVRAFAGDVHATLLLPHQVLLAREDALLLGVDHLEMAHVASSAVATAAATETLLLECIVDDWRAAAQSPSERYVQLSPWVFEALKLREGSAVAIKRAEATEDASAECQSIELSVVRKHPAAVRSTSSSNSSSRTTASLSSQPHRSAADAAFALALRCLPASVRDGKIHLERALERQLRSSRYHTAPLARGALLAAQLLQETYVFRVEQVVYAPSSPAPATDAEQASTSQVHVRVRAWTAPATELTLASLNVQDQGLEAVAPNDSTLSTRLWAAGFAGYDAFVQDVLLNVALVVKGTPAASRTSASPAQIGSHGILLSGVLGAGKSLACRVLETEIARAGIRTKRIDGMALVMAAERSRLASTYDFLLQELDDAFPDLASACDTSRIRSQTSRPRCTGVVLLDDVDALFATASGAVADESDSAETLSPLGSALLRLLDAISDATQLCVVGTTTSADAAIPGAAKRSGRFGKTLELLVPTEAMRSAILARHIRALPLRDDESGAVDATAARLAALTGGYVAKDLVRICRHALVLASKTTEAKRATAPRCVTWDNLVAAQQLVKPSQLRELNVASPGQATTDALAFAGYVALQQQLVDFITWKFSPTAAMNRLGVANASGILVHGPSGCGKSLLVRTLAAHARVNVVSVKSSEIMSKYFGDSEKAVRELFAAPCILFFDEFDAIAHKRSFGDGASGSGDSVYARILSTFLNEMDGVGAAASSSSTATARGEILVIAATNRVDALDAALVRPGRIDKTMELGFPTVADKEAILAHCTRKMPLAADVDLAALAHRATGARAFTGADLAAVCKDAAFRALRDDMDAETVAMRHFDVAWRHRVGESLDSGSGHKESTPLGSSPQATEVA